jgi:anti-sigma factor RsiW
MARVRDINCRHAVELMGDYLENRLSRRDRRRLEHHLAACDPCSTYLEEMRTTIELTGRVEVDDLRPEVLDALMGVYDDFWRDKGERTAGP